mmetsp:Transcript_16099/g.22452  ORF Transcript_16099/g.22452 Transcript_16099/m.22452 type:complete len:311 (-) Transcript_16099:150-1082(-)
MKGDQDPQDPYPLYGNHGDGRMYDVPPGWAFPIKPSRKSAFNLWMLGQANYEGESGEKQPIRPFRGFNTKRLPKNLLAKFKLEWRPVFLLMEQAPLFVVPEDRTQISTEKVEELYHIGTEHLKTVVSYIWQLPRSVPEKWSIGEWCKRVKFSAIRRDGTPQDIAQLGPATHRNRAHSQSRRPPRGRRSAPQGSGTIRPSVPQEEDPEDVVVDRPARRRRMNNGAQDDDFGSAFGSVTETEQIRNAEHSNLESSRAQARVDAQDGTNQRLHGNRRADEDGNPIHTVHQAPVTLAQVNNAGDGGTNDAGFMS